MFSFSQIPIFHHTEANKRKHSQVVVNVAIVFENKDTIIFTETAFFSRFFFLLCTCKEPFFPPLSLFIFEGMQRGLWPYRRPACQWIQIYAKRKSRRLEEPFRSRNPAEISELGTQMAEWNRSWILLWSLKI